MRMLENNNRKIITKMAVSSMKRNKPKFKEIREESGYGRRERSE